MGDHRKTEYAEDFTDGTENLPPEVRAYMREQRQFWRQVRGDDGPQRDA